MPISTFEKGETGEEVRVHLNELVSAANATVDGWEAGAGSPLRFYPEFNGFAAIIAANGTLSVEDEGSGGRVYYVWDPDIDLDSVRLVGGLLLPDAFVAWAALDGIEFEYWSQGTALVPVTSVRLKVYRRTGGIATLAYDSGALHSDSTWITKQVTAAQLAAIVTDWIAGDEAIFEFILNADNITGYVGGYSTEVARLHYVEVNIG